MDFDFQRYIQQRRASGAVAEAPPPGRAAWAFSRDRKVLQTLDRARFVEAALKATLSLEERLLDHELLASAQPTSPEEHPRLHRALAEASQRLGVPRAPIALVDAPGEDAVTVFGMEGEPQLLLAPWTLELLDDDELLFVVGRGLGHIEAAHAPYLTTIFALDQMSDAFYGWVVKPAQMALGAWRRHGAVTADRAGLLASRSLVVAVRALVKIGLSGEHGLEEVLERLAGRKTLEELSSLVDHDLARSRRLLALRAFARSQPYRQSLGKEDGESLTSIDREVESIVKIW
ncbi:MAG: hypothetical protein CMH57_11140 [Myxococcales bacterium]|nr:hypothetical protein [Myxococcales bacterium]